LIKNIVNNDKHKITVETIAEFVSDEVIYLGLKGIGVDFSQGYYIGKPCELN
jgi:EAL domain-containing protein (putative c-di-GMP-specific phosphodiesterase class I)